MTFAEKLKKSIRTYRQLHGMNYYVLEDDEPIKEFDCIKYRDIDKNTMKIFEVGHDDVLKYPTLASFRMDNPKILEVLRQLPRDFP